MSSPQQDQQDPVVESEPEEEPLLGMLDYVLIVLILLALLYWYLNKKKEDPSPVYKIQPTMITSSSAMTQNKNFLTKMKNNKRRMVVFYGSQTGTAEEFAGRLSNEGIRYGMKGVVADPEETDMEDLTKLPEVDQVLDKPTLAVFCIATYGEGDPTDNCQEFFNWLKSGEVDLNNMKYAVFALGNKTYEHFNKAGIYVDDRLHELGARRIHPIGLGDDDANLDDDFITWKKEFWTSVCTEFNIEETGEDFSMRQFSAKVLETYEDKKLYRGEPARLRSFQNQRPPFDVKNPFMSTVTVNRNLHSPESDRVCLHMELDISGSRIRYESGDHVAIYPTNDLRLVERIGELLNLDLNTVFTMTPLDEDALKKQPFPCPTTLKTALLHYVDITALPRTHVLKEIAEYASDPSEKEKLLRMVSTAPEGKEFYQEWIVKSCRHITHILEDMPGLKPDIYHLMELLPRLQPRFYSISSSSRMYNELIHVTAVVVRYTTPTGRENKGVCTTWLEHKVPIPDNEDLVYKVPIFVRRSNFRLPNRPQTPVIMVGPGTGLAPFRGFIQDRAWQKKQGKPIGDTHLFFGCRNEAVDFIYSDEMREYEKEGVIRLHTAFSRDQKDKVYVTHRIRENSELIFRLIDKENANFYICGDAKNMAKDVHDLMIEIIEKYGEKTREEAAAYVKNLEERRRYSADVWS